MEANYPQLEPKLTIEDSELKHQEVIETTRQITKAWIWPTLGLLVISLTISGALAYQHFVGPLNLPLMPPTPTPAPLVTPKPTASSTYPTPTPVPDADREQDGCKIGGCSGQLCGDQSDELISTCEFQPEYSCYQTATCARLEDGTCGWLDTKELSSCLQQPGPDVKVNPINLRDTQRQADLNKLSTAVYNYAVDHQGELPPDYPMISTCIGAAAGCYDLGPHLTPTYLEELPRDPITGTTKLTGYTTFINSVGRLTFSSVSEATPEEPLTVTR